LDVKLTILERKIRHDMAKDNKAAYIKAAQCLLTSPQKMNKLPGAKTRWDEITALHQIHALQIHTTGTFLPYHRYFLRVHQALLAECGYTGDLPYVFLPSYLMSVVVSANMLQSYWDETRDAPNFSTSPVFDTVLGFGGSGKGTPPCVVDGPFVNATVSIGPGFTTQPRCINRRITNALSARCGATAVAASLQPETYETMLDAVYSGPHLYGHMALSMMVCSPVSRKAPSKRRSSQQQSSV
jgi:tyrosinase